MTDKPLKKGLINEWGKRVFVNPPYSNIRDWIVTSYTKARNFGSIVVMLIPSRTDTKYWHEYVMKADEIRFIKGRLKFNDGKGSAPFPSAIIIFRGSTIHNSD
jgi:site-specific DNA-methyltransferase (adenine-specific)